MNENPLYLLHRTFIERMQRELEANTAQKGDWRDWKPDLALLDSEMRHHLYKLNQAVLDGKSEKVAEYAADVAVYAMKYFEMFGDGDGDGGARE